MVRQRSLPITVAMALTLAAALLIVEDHVLSPVVAERALANSGTGSPGVGRTAGARIGEVRVTDDAATGQGGQAKPAAPGVGSRALTGNDADASSQPQMATGVDLKGPPKRFPANETPE